MQISLPDLLAPHYCISCDEIGSILCERCKCDIVEELAPCCLSCNKALAISTMECTSCQLPYSKQWCTGELGDSLKSLIYAMKFERNSQAIAALVDILDATVAQLPSDTVVAYIPTIRTHIRQRGYDHAKKLAQGFAHLRGLRIEPVLERSRNTVQRGESRSTRRKQARDAFMAKGVQPVTYLLIDDVSTTGATIEAGAAVLMAAGACDVWVAVLAHQPLESTPKN